TPKCHTCSFGYYPKIENNKICVGCDGTCDNKCNTQNGYCYGCLENYVFNLTDTFSCQKCEDFDSNCKNCSSNYTQTCVECKEGFYPLDGICVLCSTIKNCRYCSTVEKKCLQCNDPFIINSQNECQSCESYTFKKNETHCDYCFLNKMNCELCDTLEVNKTTCKKCYSPFVVDVYGNCVLCDDNKFYKNETCLFNENCQKGINETFCLKCDVNFFLSQNKCFSSNGCKDLSLFSCNCENVYAVNSECSQLTNCKYLYSSQNIDYCLSCEDNFALIDTECTEPIAHSKIMKNNYLYLCENYYYSKDNKCLSCDNEQKMCLYTSVDDTKTKALMCDDTRVINYTSELCFLDNNCKNYESNQCTKCKIDNYYISNGTCAESGIENCITSINGKCYVCNTNYLKDSNDGCSSITDLFCCKSNSYSCITCFENYTKTTLNPSCEKINETLNCKVLINGVCKECVGGFYLYNSECFTFNNSEVFDLTHDENNIKIENESQQYGIDCIIHTQKGCIKCSPKTYLNRINSTHTMCKKCSNNCEQCYNETFCLSCSSNYYLDSSNKCSLMGDLQLRCRQMMLGFVGCAICNDLYYKVGTDCLRCDSSCSTCLNPNECTSCIDGFYIIKGESYTCQNYSTLENCQTKTPGGCILCNEGFYLQNWKCHFCSTNCTQCDSIDLCNSCENGYILMNGICVHYTSIQSCLSAQNDKCTKCDGLWKKPDNDGKSCVFAVNYGIIIGCPLAFLFVVFVLLILLFFIVFEIQRKRKEKNDAKNICVFEIDKSNVTMDNRVCENIFMNKKELKFDNDLENDNQSELPVGVESRDLICVGNFGKQMVKLQFSTTSDCDQYSIRTNPQMIILKSGFACEFEIFITPNCTCNLHEHVVLIVLDIMKNKQKNSDVPVDVVTKLTTKLDYREIITERILGEGSFGVVYKGKYRGDTVAIKKMKQTAKQNSQIKEFEEEVEMLGKFRSEYIVHFYGAVFIPDKICMVTEFASFGSLQNLMEIKNKEEINIKIKIKFMSDAVRGIKYLHDNGILHRDIKPDNLLVFSLEDNQKVNAKLTDFGSSRNINMLMTNMTFTKGVGTPKYMAPEILDKKKYTTYADIYSFSIMLYETVTWEEMYPKDVFKYPWDIAAFVTNGKRKEIKKDVPIEIGEVIEKTWNQNSSERISLEEVGTKLDQFVNKS
ncbi:protein serine/threonine kinase, putative, partial [Entamoeba invadens IP1]